MIKLTSKEKAVISTEMETILSSKIDIIEGLELIEESKTGNISEVVSLIKNQMINGTSFTEAVRNEGNFDNYFEKMVEIGELNGRLDSVFNELSTYYEREDYLEKRLQEAITYPIILIWMMCAILLVLVFKVLPIFENIMNRMGIGFNTSTKTLFSVFKIVLIVSLVILLVFTLVTVIYFVYNKIKGNKPINSKILGKLSLTKNLFETTAIAKLTYALTLFVSSGYPLEEAINYLGNISDSPELNQKIKNAKDSISKGDSFVEAINKEKFYVGNSAGLLSVGVKAGKQEETFKKLTSIYENEVEEKTDNFLNIIEPLIIAVLCFVVGVILISIMLPLISVMGSIA